MAAGSGQPVEDVSVVLDLDGTLVDSLYVHVTAWAAALAEAGRPQPMWRIHRAIGLGSDRLLVHLLGEVPGEDLRETLTEGHRSRFLDRVQDLRPTRGALLLLEDIADRGVAAVVATSAGGQERQALMAVLGDPDLAITDSDSADDSKPGPAPLVAAGRDLPPSASTLMVGDTAWDGHAALRAGMRFIAVRCGGFGDDELRAAGADLIADDPAGLLGLL